MPYQSHCPASGRFRNVELTGNGSWSSFGELGFSAEWLEAVKEAPRGDCVFWGMRFAVGERPVVMVEGGEAVTVPLAGVKAGWLVFAQTSDFRPIPWNEQGFVTANPGKDRLGELAATYTFVYEDGSEAEAAIKRGHQLGQPVGRWGDNCTQAIFHGRNQPIRGALDRIATNWGWQQTMVEVKQAAAFTHWLWAWENPHPEKALAAIRFAPGIGRAVVSGLVAGDCGELPLRWRTRRKAVLTLPVGTEPDLSLDDAGLNKHVQLDMGMVISATPQPRYPKANWEVSYNNQLPELPGDTLLVEYTSHADAAFHLPDGTMVPVREVETGAGGPLVEVTPATRRVKLLVTAKGSPRPVAVKLHVHGEAGEYLPPMDRHRQPNGAWYEDYSADFLHQGIHLCSYISGETELKLPLGKVYLEVSKGFEIEPVRRVVEIGESTEELHLELERVIPWADRGWRSADTHVHFLSPVTGLLEGAAEGVNVVNLLSSQWGELFTNIGDFDGRQTWGSKEAGGDGEYLLRVGTENRQHVLGHISLVGYDGPPILPLCTAGTEEAALGDAVEVLITEWARQCRERNGLVVIPHHPRPRLEAAATFVEEAADAVEFCSWADLYTGLDPYSLSDWYRYLNCGYLVAAVGGTDKMAAVTAVGTCRSYARIPDGVEFTYESWKEAVRSCQTFVTFGPLLEMSVDGRPMGSRIAMSKAGGTVDVTWEVASVRMPMTRVELMANGEIIRSVEVKPDADEGTFRVKVERSTWLAILVRGKYPDRPEMIAAHATPVMIDLEGSPFHSAADALTILEQIEGAMAYLDTLGTRAETAVYKRMRLVLTGAHRKLHNQLHHKGVYHSHTTTKDHH